MADYLFQEANDRLHAGFFNKDIFKQKEVQLLVLETAIAGMRFHIDSEEDAKATKELAAGTELKLYREPDNEHDKWAIAVYTMDDNMLGYITRYKNETIARLMDSGKKFIAYVGEPIENDDVFRQKYAPTERGGLPILIYMVET